jgi:hypothetical protein
MRLEGKNLASQPGVRQACSQVDHAPDNCIAITEWVMKIPYESRDTRIHRQVGWKLAAVNEHLGAGTDGGEAGLYQHLARGRSGVHLLADFSLAWSDKVNSPARRHHLYSLSFRAKIWK